MSGQGRFLVVQVCRQMFRQPVLSLVTIVLLVLGVTATLVTGGIVKYTFLRKLSVYQPNRLVRYAMKDGESEVGLSGPQYQILKAMQRTSTTVFAWATTDAPVRVGRYYRVMKVAFFDSSAIDTLGIRLALGGPMAVNRSRSDENDKSWAILSDETWRDSFGSDPNIINKNILVSGKSLTIIGVMPREFDGLTAEIKPGLYLPLGLLNDVYDDPTTLTAPGNLILSIFGRLAPGWTRANASAETTALRNQVNRQADPSGKVLDGVYRRYSLVVEDGSKGIDNTSARIRNTLTGISGLVLLLLMLCMVNTLLVVLGRVSARQSQFALQNALGASRFFLYMATLLEVLSITIPSSAIATVLSVLVFDRISSQFAASGNAILLGKGIGASLIATEICGVIIFSILVAIPPAIAAFRASVVDAIKKNDSHIIASRKYPLLLLFEVTVASGISIIATYSYFSLRTLLAQPSGLATDNTAVVSIDLSGSHLDALKIGTLVTRLEGALRQSPGIISVGFSAALPLSDEMLYMSEFSVDRQGNVHSNPKVGWIAVAGNYFDALGTRLQMGSAKDGAGNGCVISKTLSDELYPTQYPIGEQVIASKAGERDGSRIDPSRACTIIAVAEDARLVSLKSSAPRVIYKVLKLQAFSPNSFAIIARAKRQESVDAEVRHAVESICPSDATIRYFTMNQRVHQDVNKEEMFSDVAGGIGWFALGLVGLSVFGITTNMALSRRREFALKIAFGATRSNIVRDLLTRTVWEIGLGQMLGVIFSLILLRFLEANIYFDIKSALAIWGAAFLGLAAICVLSVIAPVFRAASIDPNEVLRES